MSIIKRPLDIVRTPKGGLAVITETSPATDNFPVVRHSITYIENPYHEHNAWWNDKDLQYLASIPVLLINAMAHPFGSNKNSGDQFYPKLEIS